MTMELKQARLPQGTIDYREQGPPGGEPILFVHGLLVNGLLWRKVTPQLAADGFRTIVPDWPLGSHTQPMEPGADLSIPGVARIVDAFMEAIGLEDVTIVGNDTGGAITQVVCAEHPKRIARLVLTNCDAYENFPPRAFKGLMVLPKIPGAMWEFAQLSRIKAIPRRIFKLLQNAPVDPEVLESFVRPAIRSAEIRRDVKKVMVSVDAAHTLGAAAKLRSFNRPALIAWGADDRFFALKWAERLARDLPDARLVPIEGAKTFVAEDAPERLAGLIAGFMRETPAS